MDDYKQYLAQKILTEDQVVTYRLLSRALKVHVNTAKEMLYEFHKSQNDKHPGKLHATYIIYGIKARPEPQDGDIDMADSQSSDDIEFPESDVVPTYTLALVSQEQLEPRLSQYSEVTSIHVYSLAPHPLKDFQLLADTARQVLELSKTDNDTAEAGKTYGTFVNPNVRRRERRGRPISPTKAPAPKPVSKPDAKQDVNSSTVVAVQEEAKPGSARVTSKPGAKKPTSSLKRQESSGIGQMFAKQAAKPKKSTAKASESPATSAAVSGAEDNQKADAMSDDGEDDAEPMEVDVKREDSGTRKLRKARQAELRRMMEESDPEAEEEEEGDKADGEEEEEDDPAAEEPPVPKTEPEEPAEVVSSTGDGRRRGRRRVMRKKQVMDENGYLVTFQEPGWESFSEDEAPPPPPPKAKPVKAAPAAKPKKGAAAAKASQGNIMSFFAKK